MRRDLVVQVIVDYGDKIATFGKTSPRPTKRKVSSTPTSMNWICRFRCGLRICAAIKNGTTTLWTTAQAHFTSLTAP